ncbi:hypothetical protein TNCV_1645421 [Trichonephila clavipes]|nr:hypothetical protein TNCV_1645421 [Trichonephila clavipes]
MFWGRGSLVVNVMDSWLTCHEFERSILEDPPCRGAEACSFSRLSKSSRWRAVKHGEAKRGYIMRSVTNRAFLLQKSVTLINPHSRSMKDLVVLNNGPVMRMARELTFHSPNFQTKPT